MAPPPEAQLGFPVGLASAVAELNWSLVQIKLIHSVLIIRKRKLRFKSNLFSSARLMGEKGDQFD